MHGCARYRGPSAHLLDSALLLPAWALLDLVLDDPARIVVDDFALASLATVDVLAALGGERVAEFEELKATNKIESRQPSTGMAEDGEGRTWTESTAGSQLRACHAPSGLERTPAKLRTLRVGPAVST